MLKPLLYEREAIRQDEAGRMWLEWRRQGHKTTTLAKKALKHMMKHRGSLVTFASASLVVGSEMIVREGQVVESAREQVVRDAQAWQATFADMQEQATKAKLKLESNGDGLKPEDFAEIFESQKLEARIWHSRTVFSRTRIIAPNPATARGWSGCVFIDEAGHIVFLADLLEAMEPIMSADPSYRLICAGTPPKDDAHISFELTLPPEGTTFTPDPKGHWYKSQAGFLVHHVDTYDAAAAGLKTYDLDTREEVTPAEHRAKAIDRDAWDRNYALIRKRGGIAAVPLNILTHAMEAGRNQCLFAEDDLPQDWRRFLTKGKFAFGLDLGTTEKQTSNPTSLTISEQLGMMFYARLILVWKTADPEFTRAILREVLDLGGDRKPRRLCIDATNERFFATSLKREFAGRVMTQLVISSENIQYGGQTLNYKSYLGNLIVNHLEDAQLALPESRYVKEDFRLVMKDRGSFVASLGTQGQHGDTFDSTKLSLHGLVAKGGPAKAEAMSVGGLSKGRPAGNWKNPYLGVIENSGGKHNA
jgi:hypothetical protein